MTVTLEEQVKCREEFASEQKAGEGILSKPLAVIEKWAVVQNLISQSFEPLEPGNRLRGYVVGRAHLSETKLAHTSTIVSVDLDLGLVETRNTIYLLGEASEEYKSWSAGVRSH